MSPNPASIDAFISRWSGARGSELANYQLFLGELIELLGLPRPYPASDDTGDDDSVAPSTAVAGTAAKIPWPKDLTDQVRAVVDTLTSAPAALTESELAERFTGRGRWRERLPRILDMLVALGNVKSLAGRYQAR